VDPPTLDVIMFRRSAHRLAITFFVVSSLLFSQWAVASYVCPAESDPAAMAKMTSSGLPCVIMDKARPALCHEHSAGTAQTFEVAKMPTPSQPMVVQVLQMPLVAAVSEAVAVPATRTPEVRPPPDPIFLSTLRLRV
jgi:hypothetical protein